ncbi:PREDICTED: uncharacterized protein LOC109217039 [Nicotiana attenuata]|uniref:uncharacterized protein LOC109217039 n=1 Tax=Nicotiana attenuata TaxID=49451 RepID=UPI0009059A45|nr:PREDICTED: uncharacterized protein LOC109217039 [Nicotiana attenuata]
MNALDSLVLNGETDASSTQRKAVNNKITQLNSIETLTSSNYKKWKQDIEIVLGLMEVDFALTEQKPAEPVTTSTTNENAKYEKWMKANKLSLMIMKRSIPAHIKCAIKDNGNAKDFLSAIGQKFLEFDKAEICSLIDSLSFIKYDLLGSVRDNIIKFINIATKLNNLGVTITDELITVCVVEEERIQKKKVEVLVNLVS